MENTFDKKENNGKALTNGAFALIIVALVALGCTCNKDFDFGRTGTGDNANSAVSNTGNDKDTTTDDTGLTAPAARADASKTEIPSEAELQYMTKTTLLDFNEAIQKGDFTDFHANISKTWRNQISAEKFKQTFQSFIDRGVDISDIRSEKATFSAPPGIEGVGRQKMLVMRGSYDISPAPTTFELKYIPEGKEWKLFGIDVRTKSFK
jgi:hypothetical protein